jgi:hypothetical protein
MQSLVMRSLPGLLCLKRLLVRQVRWLALQ